MRRLAPQSPGEGAKERGQASCPSPARFLQRRTSPQTLERVGLAPTLHPFSPALGTDAPQPASGSRSCLPKPLLASIPPSLLPSFPGGRFLESPAGAVTLFADGEGAALGEARGEQAALPPR